MKDKSPARVGWKINTNIPVSSYRGKAVSYGNKIYIIGGKSVVYADRGDDLFRNTIISYDTETGLYDRSLSPMSGGRCNFAAGVSEDGNIYVAGGVSGSHVLDTCEVYNIEADTWSNIADMPDNNEKTAGAVYGNYFYVFGGVEDAIYKYNIVSGSWSTLAEDMGTTGPFGNIHPIVEIVGDYIWAIGGLEIKKWDPDPSVDDWVESYEIPRYYLDYFGYYGLDDGIVSSVRGDKIYITGGEPPPYKSSQRFLSYNTVNHEWDTTLPNMIIDKEFAVSSIVNNNFYVIGGWGNKQFYDERKDYDRYIVYINESYELDGVEIREIPDQTISRKSGSFVEIPLNDYTYSFNYSNEALTWTYTSDANFDIDITNGVATITPPSLPLNRVNCFEKSTITFTATAPDGTYDQETVTFEITGWETNTPVPSLYAAAGAKAVAYGSKIYIIGGKDANYSGYLDTIIEYDPSTDSYDTTLPPMTTARAYFAADVSDSGIIYVMGGRNTAGRLSLCEKYDINAHTWSEVAPMFVALGDSYSSGYNEGAFPNCDNNGTLYGDYFYIFGGDNRYKDNVYKCDINAGTSGSWYCLDSQRFGIGPVVETVEDYIYVLGGNSKGPWTPRTIYNSLYVWDPSIDDWSGSLALYPGALALAAQGVGAYRTASCVYGTKIYMAGGCGQSDYDDSIYTKEFISYDTATNTWERLNDMPAARYLTAGALTNNTFYVFIGIEYSDGSGDNVNTNESYELTGVHVRDIPDQTIYGEDSEFTEIDLDDYGYMLDLNDSGAPLTWSYVTNNPDFDIDINNNIAIITPPDTGVDEEAIITFRATAPASEYEYDQNAATFRRLTSWTINTSGSAQQSGSFSDISGARTVTYNDKIYIIAGGGGSTTLISYDPSIDEGPGSNSAPYKTLSSMNNSRDYPAVGIQGSTIYVAGGTTNSCEKYNILTGDWTPIADSPKGTEDCSAGATYKNYFYIFSRYVFAKYDIIEDTWEAIRDLDPDWCSSDMYVRDGLMRKELSAVTMGDYIWLIGTGVDYRVQKWKPSIDDWAASTYNAFDTCKYSDPDSPYGQDTDYASNAVVVGTKIYIAGGRKDYHVIGNPYHSRFDVDYLTSYDTVTDTWDGTLLGMPTARNSVTLGVVQDTIYAIGGETAYWEELTVNESYKPLPPTSIIEVFNIPNQTICRGEEFLPINLDDYVSSPYISKDDLTWTHNYDGGTAFAINITADNIVTVEPPEDETWAGDETIIFTATAPDGTYAQNTAVYKIDSTYARLSSSAGLYNDEEDEPPIDITGYAMYSGSVKGGPIFVDEDYDTKFRKPNQNYKSVGLDLGRIRNVSRFKLWDTNSAAPDSLDSGRIVVMGSEDNARWEIVGRELTYSNEGLSRYDNVTIVKLTDIIQSHRYWRLYIKDSLTDADGTALTWSEIAAYVGDTLWTVHSPIPQGTYENSYALGEHDGVAGSRAVVYDDKIYMVGGYQYNITSDKLVRYDPSTDTYEELPSMHTARREFAAGISGSTIFAAGSYRDGHSVEKYDIEEGGAWENLSDMPTIEALSTNARAGAVYNNYFYVFGALAGVYGSTVVFKYNIGEDFWTTIEPEDPNYSIGRPSNAVVVGNYIWVLGADGPASIRKWDLSNDEWVDEVYPDAPIDTTLLSTYPPHIEEAAVAAYGPRIYVAGGRVFSWRRASSQFRVYDTIANTWQIIPDNMHMRRGHACAGIADGQFYVIGGEPGACSWGCSVNESHPILLSYDASVRSDAVIAECDPYAFSYAGPTGATDIVRNYEAFDVKLRHECNHYFNDTQYTLNTCPRCLGKGYYYDIQFNAIGRVMEVKLVDKLIQTLEKFVLTENNNFHSEVAINVRQWLGDSPISEIKSIIKFELSKSLLTLMNTQRGVLNLASEAQIASIDSIEVFEDVTDPGKLEYLVVITTEAGNSRELVGTIHY